MKDTAKELHCGRCKKAKKRWICRVCERKVCEHVCLYKTSDGKATCGACRR